MNDDFVFVDEHLPGVFWDAKYATWDNFTGRPVVGYLANRIVATRQLCDALAVVREEAAALGLGLLLWDAYRPQRAVDSFVEWSRRPEDGRTKPRHYPNIERAEMFERGYIAARSGHSRGGTVDLTLFRLDNGQLAEMGGGYDLMDAVSHHGAAGIARDAARNRERLRHLMEASGFAPYEREWWHYTLADEPYPDTYFDFPIVAGHALHGI
ncbi:MAG: D-Ala-D-Ala dipeptidase VanX [Actinobacteria bacterium]|nr:D-Ala-D-Ala dipeptidase VanX [Actinomycetota bacterium]